MRLVRLVTGLIVAAFVVGHFLNHALGVASIEAMDRMRAVLAAWWRSPVGTVLLYGSLLTHFVLALISLYRRSTLRMPAWEAAQLILGLAIPPLLIAHVVGTRFTWTLLGHNIDYERIVGLLWSSEMGITRQSLLLLVNTAARFEDMTKAFGCTLVVSAEALRQAQIEPGGSPQHQVRVRGKTERLTVYAVTDPRTLNQGQTTFSRA